MIIEQVRNDGRTQLMMQLQKLTSSLSKRNVSFVITAHSGYVATFNLIVTGKTGSAQKTFAIVFNQTTQEWEAFCDGYVYKMISLGEISTVIKSMVNKLSVLLHKV